MTQAVAGAGGGVFAALVLQPVEVVKTRQQLHRSGKLSSLQALREVVAQHGFAGLFSGVGAKGVDTGSRYFVYFFAYDALSGAARRFVEFTTAVNLVVGYAAGVVAVTCTTPLDVAATRLQAGSVHGGLRGALAQAVREDGWLSLYAGYGFNLALCVNPAIANTMFDRVKALMLGRRSRSPGASGTLSSVEAFVLGAFAKAVAVLLTYPLTRLKTILQVRGQRRDGGASDGGGGADPAAGERGLPGAALDVAPGSVSRSLGTLFAGLEAQLLKAVLQAALLFAAKERIEGASTTALRMLSKALQVRRGRTAGPLAAG